MSVSKTHSPAPEIVLPSADSRKNNLNPNPAPKMTQSLYDLPVANEKTIRYYEFDAGRKILHKLNFDSPRTLQAASEVGVSFNDCLTKYFRLSIKN